jgi:hypothetical protein
VPSALPQPKLNSGLPVPVGVTCSLTVAAGTVAPVAQALTVQRACLPRSLLACVAVTATQRLAWAAGVVLADAAGPDVLLAGVLSGEALGVAVDVGAGVSVVPVGVGVMPVGVGVVLVGVGVAEGDVVVGDVVGVAEGLDDGAASCSGSHDCVLGSASALVAVRARLTPETAVSRTPPATRATAAGRRCANRMNAYRCRSLPLGTAHPTTPVLPGWLGSSRAGACRSGPS